MDGRKFLTQALRDAPWIDNACDRPLVGDMTKEEECFTKMEDTLHSQTELADGSPIRNLVAQAVTANAAVVLRLESAVIDDAERITLEQGVFRFTEPWNQGEHHMRGLGIIGVLDQLLENWKATFVSISEIVPQPLNHFERILDEARIYPHSHLLELLLRRRLRTLSRSGLNPIVEFQNYVAARTWSTFSASSKGKSPGWVSI